MTKAKATKLDKEIQEGFYDPKKETVVSKAIRKAKTRGLHCPDCGQLVYSKLRRSQVLGKDVCINCYMKAKQGHELYDPKSHQKSLQVGDDVFHPHYGDGYIKKLHPKGYGKTGTPEADVSFNAGEVTVSQKRLTRVFDPKKPQSEYKKFESVRLSAYTKSFGSRAKAKSAIRKAWLAYKRKERDTAMRLNDLPSRWYEAMVRGIKKSSDVRNPYSIVKSIWSKLSLSKRAEIKAREKKGERFKYDLPLPVDKPTRGTGTVRMVKPFKLAEVQVNLSVKDYLSALKSGLFSRMKRHDGTTALVKRCKSKDGRDNVNIFVDRYKL